MSDETPSELIGRAALALIPTMFLLGTAYGVVILPKRPASNPVIDNPWVVAAVVAWLAASIAAGCLGARYHIDRTDIQLVVLALQMFLMGIIFGPQMGLLWTIVVVCTLTLLVVALKLGVDISRSGGGAYRSLSESSVA